MSDDRCLLVFRADGILDERARDQLVADAESIRERLANDDAPLVIINGRIHAYWLRPGDSTVEADARAEAIRKEASA